MGKKFVDQGFADQMMSERGLTRIPGIEREYVFACVEYAAQSNEPPPAAAMRKSG